MEHWQRQAIFLEGVLLLSCICSDLLPRTLLSGFLRSRGAAWGAVADNVSHTGIAAASWAVVVSLSPPPSPAAASYLLIPLPGSPVRRCVSCAAARPGARGGETRASGFVEVVFAASVGSALDLDHFLAAGSLRLSRATDLAGRPWGHCVAALVVAAFAMGVLTYNVRAAASVFSAGLSHQLRDATRRGLWLYPPQGPRTPPLGYSVYLVAQALLPLIVALCVRGGFVSRCGSCVKGIYRSRRLQRWREPCARSRSGNEDKDRDRSASFPL